MVFNVRTGKKEVLASFQSPEDWYKTVFEVMNSCNFFFNLAFERVFQYKCPVIV